MGAHVRIDDMAHHICMAEGVDNIYAIARKWNSIPSVDIDREVILNNSATYPIHAANCFVVLKICD